MKKYRLKKDLPTFKIGDIFTLSEMGLWKDIGEQVPILVYPLRTLKKFPNILEDWFEEIPEKPKTVWELEDGDTYFDIDGLGVINQLTWHGSYYDRQCRWTGNAFLTCREAQKEHARRHAKQILLRDTKGFEVEPNNSNEWKFYVDYTMTAKELIAVIEINHLSHEIYFATKEDAEASIKEHEKEWKAYLGVEE